MTTTKTLAACPTPATANHAAKPSAKPAKPSPKPAKRVKVVHDKKVTVGCPAVTKRVVKLKPVPTAPTTLNARPTATPTPTNTPTATPAA